MRATTIEHQCYARDIISNATLLQHRSGIVEIEVPFSPVFMVEAVQRSLWNLTVECW